MPNKSSKIVDTSGNISDVTVTGSYANKEKIKDLEKELNTLSTGYQALLLNVRDLNDRVSKNSKSLHELEKAMEKLKSFCYFELLLAFGSIIILGATLLALYK